MAGDVMAISAGKTLTIYLAADLKKFNNGISQAQGGLKGLSGTMKNMLGPAAIGAGIAVAGLATKMAIDGVKAAAEDEVSLAKLTQTLENLKLAHSTEEIDTFIDSLEQSVGYLGDLRPAYDRLIRSTRDTAEANQLLSLSLDVAAGTGKSVEAVAEALGKAYDGNTGALGRLGAGIDKTTIASGNMNKITGVLADTFGGQASAQADTFNGNLQKLQRATEQLSEAFGQGLLKGLGDATGGTNNLVKSMEDLEPLLEGLGKSVGTFATTTLGSYQNAIKRTAIDTDTAAESMKGLEVASGATGSIIGEIFASLTGPKSPLGVFGSLLGRTEVAIDSTAQAAADSVQYWNKSTYAVNMSTEAYAKYVQANLVGRTIIQNANKDYMDLAARQKVVNTFTYEYIDDLDELTPKISGASAAVEKLTKKEKELTNIYEATSLSLTKNRADLALYTQELQTATDAIDDFTSGMQANLLAGIDLGAAFTGQFDEAGAATGVSLLEGFNKQIDQAEYFGNVLNAIKAQGADSRLIEQIAGLGPEVGAKLGQQMLDEGLVPELNNRFVHVQDATKELAMKLVPEFLIAGQESALTMVDSISEQMAKEVTRLAKIGKRIAKPLGQAFRAELLTDVAAALKEVEAAGAAGRVEAVARAETRQVALTNAAVAQALQNLVRSADARNGAPIAPVLS
jgi:hypothetical protein